MEQKQKFPTEMVELPSKGLLYPTDSPLAAGTIEMKYMTAREEDILTNQNYIQQGTVIDKLLQSLIVTPINYGDLLTGDKNAILIASRILGYGQDYEFENKGIVYKVDLTEMVDKELPEDVNYENGNNFSYGDFVCKGFGGYYYEYYRPRNQWVKVYVTPQINNITTSYLFCMPNHPRIWRREKLLEIGSFSELLPICDDQEIILIASKLLLISSKMKKLCLPIARKH